MTTEVAIRTMNITHEDSPLRQTVISALEKQMPVKVDTTAKEWRCPICGVELHGTRYCPNCGQALDWGNDE